ncbi:hypothetical protein [Aeromicrobium choanae]|nr:hypothetical protein [Aeromicrobium choanae]
MTRAALVAVLALIASLLIAPAGAAQLPAAAPAGTISGTITSTADLPDGVLEARVSLLRKDANGRFVLENMYTRIVGERYTIPVPAANTYRVDVELDEWGVSTAGPSAPVVVQHGQAVTGVDIVLEPEPRISGRISMEDFDLDSLDRDRTLLVQALANVEGAWKPVGSVDRLTFGDPALRIHRDGTFTLAVERPTTRVRLKFFQPHCGDGSDPFCDMGLAPEVSTTFWDGTASGASTVEVASDIDLAAGSVEGKDVAMRRAQRLRFTAEPTITGNPVPGHVLTAQPGTYQPAPTGMTYTWTAAAPPGYRSYKVVGTGSTFRVPATFANHAVRLTVQPLRPGFETPILSTSTTIKAPSRLAVKARAGRRTATATLTVAAEVKRDRLDGKASIYAKGKRIKTVRVKDGRATIKISKQKKGKRTYTVRFSGNAYATSSTKSVRIAIR